MINIVLRLRKANVKWLSKYKLLSNKQIRYYTGGNSVYNSCIYNTFNTTNMIYHIYVHYVTHCTDYIHGFIIRTFKTFKKKRIWWSKEEKTVDVLRLPQSQWRRWPATPDFFCVDCLTSGQIRRSKNPILNIFYIYKTFT